MIVKLIVSAVGYLESYLKLIINDRSERKSVKNWDFYHLYRVYKYLKVL